MGTRMYYKAKGASVLPIGSRARYYYHVKHLLRTKVGDPNSNAMIQIDEQVQVKLTFQTDEPELVTNQPRTVSNPPEP